MRDGSGTTALESINKKEQGAGPCDRHQRQSAFLCVQQQDRLVYVDHTSRTVSRASSRHGASTIRSQVAVSTGIGASYIYCINDNQCPGGGHRVAEGRSWKVNPDFDGHRERAKSLSGSALECFDRFVRFWWLREALTLRSCFLTDQARVHGSESGRITNTVTSPNSAPLERSLLPLS